MAFAPNWSGKQIGDFLIEAPIGRGGMAMVYSARQRSVDRQVALKIIDLQPGDDTDFLKRFTREAEVIAMLEHIHILPVYGYGVLQDEAAYFAMRLLRHGSLADLLRQGALPLDDAVDLFAQIASGLQYMHSRGVIHRDLKPSNILLDENGNAYLSDFGLARMTDVTVNISEQAFHTAGTPAYLAPELIDGKVADPLSDIYSLGVLLYQMLCGCLPFQAEEGGISALLYKHMREPPPPMHLINPAVPPAVEAVVMRALSKNRRERFASADEMAYELRSATLGSSTSVPRARALVSGLLPRSARQRRVFFGGLFIFCLIAFLAAFALTQKNSSPPMNVLAGAHAGSADLTLTDGEIALAHARLGVSGFVAYFPCTMSDAFQTTVARELSDEASQDGLLLRLYDSQDDPARLLTLIEQARLEGAKAFILCPLGEPLLDDTIRSLQSATIPLVLALDYDSTYGVKVELDNEAVGQVQGRYAGEILLAEHEGHGTVVVLSMMEVAAGRARAQGMIDGLREAAPQADVLAPLSGYTRDQAKVAITSLIASGTHFDAILTVTDASALGAIDALKAANVSPQDVFIVSANDEEPVRSYIREGYYVRGSVAIDPLENARLMMTGMVKALAGSPVPEYLTLSSGEMDTAAQ